MHIVCRIARIRFFRLYKNINGSCRHNIDILCATLYSIQMNLTELGMHFFPVDKLAGILSTCSSNIIGFFEYNGYRQLFKTVLIISSVVSCESMIKIILLRGLHHVHFSLAFDSGSQS